MEKFLICGGGGFVGSHLANALKQAGYWVRVADLKMPEFLEGKADEFLITDLREFDNCLKACEGIDYVAQLAADMGGIWHITLYRADVASHNSLINLNMLEAARLNKVKRYLYTSSACVYPSFKQNDENVAPLKEEDAIPADPEPGYGWEKLYAEQLCEYYRKDYGLDIRVVRFHNVYGPGTFEGGREKAPAALCRKIALAKDGDEVEIWGDGEQTRSFMHVSDCVDGIMRIFQSEYQQPLNLGRDELVSVNGLFDIIAGHAGKTLTKNHDLSKPQGVRGRNSDNTRIKEILNWAPLIDLNKGLKWTYDWVNSQVQTREFYKQFISPGNLVFDVGANCGNKTKVFQDIGARVIAVEPQQKCIEYFRKRFPDTTLVAQALGAEAGVGSLSCGEAWGLSSMSQDWMDAVTSTQRFEGYSWPHKELTPITTLDNLISEFGVPDFIKIDVEGFEHEVLAGLSVPVKALCFEFHPEYLDSTEKCIRRLESLGPVLFSKSLFESYNCGDWVSGNEILEHLRAFTDSNKIYGDVYARFQ